MNIFTQFFKTKASDPAQVKRDMVTDLIRRESELNRDLFGPVPRGVKRNFFCLDKHTWIWHEEWTDKKGQNHKTITKYLVRDNEIIKSVNGGQFSALSLDEVKNFHKATKKYGEKVNSQLYVSHQHPKGI